MKRQASARWTGTLKDGKGLLSTATGALKNQPYSFASRFTDGQKDTNPEELIGSAHAGCFSMALSGVLEQAGHIPNSIETSAIVTIDKVDGNWTVTSSHLIVNADVPGIDENKFRQLAEEAKNNCPVSRLLKADLSVDATLSTGSEKRTQSGASMSAAPH